MDCISDQNRSTQVADSLTKDVHEEHDAWDGEQVVVKDHRELVHPLLVCGVLSYLQDTLIGGWQQRFNACLQGIRLKTGFNLGLEWLAYAGKVSRKRLQEEASHKLCTIPHK
eukprot:953256-Pelagomonas_calceolata.AAC.3